MNFINNYLKGKFNLVYTFWSSFGLYNIFVILKVLLSETNKSFYSFVDLISVIFIILSNIGVWNSSKNYLNNNKDNVLWGYLAKIYVIIISSLMIFSFISGFILEIFGSS
jgi:hypothetical protein